MESISPSLFSGMGESKSVAERVGVGMEGRKAEGGNLEGLGKMRADLGGGGQNGR